MNQLLLIRNGAALLLWALLHGLARGFPALVGVLHPVPATSNLAARDRYFAGATGRGRNSQDATNVGWGIVIAGMSWMSYSGGGRRRSPTHAWPKSTQMRFQLLSVLGCRSLAATVRRGRN